MQQQNNSLEAVIKQASKKKSIIFDIKKTWSAYLVLAVLVIASFMIRSFVERKVISDMQVEFDKSCSSVVSRVDNQYERIAQVITSTQGLYYENVQVVRDYFELSGAVPVKTYPFIMSISFAPKVLYSDWGAFHYAAMSEGYWKFDLHPSGVREFYYPAEHIVDLEKNKHRIAYDYATDAIIKTAIDTSIKLNHIVTTEFYDLRFDTLSFALIATIFKQNTDFSSEAGREKNFMGSLIMEVDANKFFTSALAGNKQNTSFPSDTSLIFAFVDKDSKGIDNNIFVSENFSLLADGFSPLLASTIPIKFANRTIYAKFYTVPDFGGSIQAKMPLLALIASLVISIIAFLLIIMLLTQKARAEEIAEKMTESQRRIMDTSKDIIAAINMNGEWLSMNPASIDLLGVEASKAIGTKITDYFYNIKDIDIWNGIANSRTEDNRVDLQFKSDNKEGDGYKWISWRFTVSKKDGVIYAIGRDITIEKQAEKEARFRAKQLELAEVYAQEAISSKNFLMTQLNHKLRNELTSSMGYMQLVADKIYDNQEELDSYISSAFEGSESAFTFISDAFEATLGNESSFSKLAVISLGDVVDIAMKNYYSAKRKNPTVSFIDNAKTAHLLAEQASVVNIFEKVFAIFDGELEVNAVENTHEGVTEIMIETKATQEVFKAVEIFNKKPETILEMLRYDDGDILLNIAKINSLMKTMLGNFKIENIGTDKNYMFITLPLIEKYKQV